MQISKCPEHSGTVKYLFLFLFDSFPLQHCHVAEENMWSISCTSKWCPSERFLRCPPYYSFFFGRLGFLFSMCSFILSSCASSSNIMYRDGSLTTQYKLVHLNAGEPSFDKLVVQDSRHDSIVLVYSVQDSTATDLIGTFEDISTIPQLKASGLKFFTLESSPLVPQPKNKLSILWFYRFEKSSGHMLPVAPSKRELLNHIYDKLFFGTLFGKHFGQFVRGENNERWNTFLEDWSSVLSDIVYNGVQVHEHMYVPTYAENTGEINDSGSYVENKNMRTEIILLKRAEMMARKYSMRKLALLGHKKAMQRAFAIPTLNGTDKYHDPYERTSFNIRTDVSISAVIIEPRDHPFLSHVISSVVTELPNVRPIHVFHGGAVTFDTLIQSLIKEGEIRMHRLEKNNFTPDEYSRLMTSEEFWKYFSTDKILVFQTDSVVCKNENRYPLQRFLDFDYIGSSKSLLQHGNGGFSLRDKKLSLQCSTPGGYDIEWEDVYFSACIQLHGGRVAEKIEQRKFGTEDYYNNRSFGAHKVNVDLKNKSDLALFRETCPNYLPEMS